MVLFVGSLSQNKGPRDLIEASRRLIGTIEHNLVLIGVGPLVAELAARNRLVIGTIRLLGGGTERTFASGCAGPPHVLPAQGTTDAGEAAGLVLLEAQACGTPVVAYDSGGTGEMMLPDVTGMLVPERDTASLGDAVRTVLELSSADHARFALAARGFVQSQRSQERSCAELAQHYESVR